MEDIYFTRREKITTEQRSTDREINLRYSIGRTEEDIRREFGSKESDLDYHQRIANSQEDYTERDLREQSDFADNFEGIKTAIGKEFEELEGI